MPSPVDEVGQRAALSVWRERLARGQESHEAWPPPRGASERRRQRTMRAQAMVELALVWMHADRPQPGREEHREA
ncbi:MAG: hypothetical protein R3E56_19935 [Burkholderiaceae bacterium]